MTTIPDEDPTTTADPEPDGIDVAALLVEATPAGAFDDEADEDDDAFGDDG